MVKNGAEMAMYAYGKIVRVARGVYVLHPAGVKQFFSRIGIQWPRRDV
jgi:hypothetical protein